MKEWKGNQKSVSTMLGMATTWNPEQRAAGDYYTTDPTAVEEFIRHLHCKGLLTGDIFTPIWEPACGCGNISKVLESHGYDVISTDLHDRGFGTSGIDFLETRSLPENCYTIITNPPYSLANEFILHAMNILPNYGTYIALMNISYLTGINRFNDIYRYGYLRTVYVYSHRINCYKNNIPTGHSSPVNYAWFEFTPYFTSRPTIEWIQRSR